MILSSRRLHAVLEFSMNYGRVHFSGTHSAANYGNSCINGSLEPDVVTTLTTFFELDFNIRVLLKKNQRLHKEFFFQSHKGKKQPNTQNNFKKNVFKSQIIKVACSKISNNLNKCNVKYPCLRNNCKAIEIPNNDKYVSKSSKGPKESQKGGFKSRNNPTEFHLIE